MTMEVGSSQASIIKRWTGGMQLFGRVTDVPGADQFTIPSLAGFPAHMFYDATAPYQAIVLWSHGGVGGVPQGQRKVITGYVSATGKFTAPGFGAPGVGIGDWVMIINSLLPQIKDDTTTIIGLLTGFEEFRYVQSVSAPAEGLDSYLGFSITLWNIDSGAIPLAKIDITAITATMERSTGGAPFSSVGITPPAFVKDDGRVYCQYKFKAAEWTYGDAYRLTVSGITATIGTTTYKIPTMVWSNAVLETASLETLVVQLQELLDGVYFDTWQGSAGTAWPKGTPQDPSNSLVDTLTMLTARKLRKIYMPISTATNLITFTAPMILYNFEGADIGLIDSLDIIQFNSQPVAGCAFKNLKLDGPTGAASQIAAEHCMLEGVFYGGVWARDCWLYSTTIQPSAGSASFFDGCWSTSFYLDMSKGTALAWFNKWSGTIVVDKMATGTVRVEGTGTIVIAAACTGGEVHAGYGIQVYDQSGGLVKVYSLEGVEVINFDPGLQDTGDLVLGSGLLDTGDLSGGAYNISVHAKPAAADFSAALTIPNAYSDIIDIIRTITTIHPTAFNGAAAHLYCDVYVDDATGLVVANKLISIDLTAIGVTPTEQDVSNAMATIYGLLNDGLAHTFYFFLWNDGTVPADTVDISQLQLTERRVLNIAINAKPAAAQISKALTLPIPTGSGAAHFIQDLFGARFNANILIFNGGAAHLYCDISIDDPTGLDPDYLLASLDMTLLGDNFNVQDIDAVTFPDIFALLQDGLPHTISAFLWTDVGDIDILVLEAWGSAAPTGNTIKQAFHIATVNPAATGLVGYDGYIQTVIDADSIHGLAAASGFYNDGCNTDLVVNNAMNLCHNPEMKTQGTGIDDIAYFNQVYLLLKGGLTAKW